MIVAAVWAVVRAGQSLEAPPKLAETWRVTGPEACVRPGATLKLTQSGVFVRASWTGGVAEGLEGKVDTSGRWTMWSTAPGTCSGDVQLEGVPSADGMTLRVVAPDCAACPEASLSAVAI